MEQYEAWSLLPALLAVVLAFALRKVAFSLGIGVVAGAVLLTGGAPLLALREAFGFVWDAATKTSHLWILGFAVSLGGLMQLLRGMGNSHGFGDRVARVARTRRGGQLVAWFLGMLFFFDDYANTLFVGSSMAPAARRLRLSREKLAFIIDGTAAPVASLAPLSSWIAVELGYIGDQLTTLNIDQDPYAIFLATIPYRFYPLLMLGFGLLVAISGRDFGPMADAEVMAQHPPSVPTVAAAQHSSAVQDRSAAGWWRSLPLLLGLGTLLFALYWTGRNGVLAGGGVVSLTTVLANASSSKSLVAATWVAALTALVGLLLAGGGMAFRSGVRGFARGARSMTEVVAVLLLAWSLGAVCAELGTAQYVVQLLGADFTPAWLPTIVFLVSSVISFATGTSWGTMGLIFPLSVPLAHQLAPGDMALLVGTVASVLSGSVFGDHCSPISDTTIMSALAAECDQLAHVRTQLPYALVVGAVSVLAGSLPVAYGMYGPYVALLLGVLVLALGLRLAGRQAEALAGTKVLGGEWPSTPPVDRE